VRRLAAFCDGLRRLAASCGVLRFSRRPSKLAANFGAPRTTLLQTLSPKARILSIDSMKNMVVNAMLRYDSVLQYVSYASFLMVG